MLKRYISSILFALLAGFSVYAQKPTKIVVSNLLPIPRTDELVVLKRAQLEAKTGMIPKDYTVWVTDSKGVHLDVQLDDFNKDGRWDEVSFLYSFKPSSAETFIVKSSLISPLKAPITKAHVRHERKNENNTFGPALETDEIPAGQPNTDFTKEKLPPFLTEGPAWENDKVGFRVYFDQRNIKDIWGKLTSDMVLEKVGTNPAVIYHHLDSWGMDILAVGQSLGAGSLALYVPGQQDTLIRLGGINMGKVQYEKISDGPVRAIFKMKYPEWNALQGQKPVSVEEIISIWGGQYFTQSEVVVKDAPKDALLVSGVVNLKSKEIHEIQGKGAKGFYTFDRQSENNDMLGMALLTPNPQYKGVGVTPNVNTDIKNTYLLKMGISGIAPSVFRYYVGWEKSNAGFATQDGFAKYMQQESDKFGSPLMIQWK